MPGPAGPQPGGGPGIGHAPPPGSVANEPADDATARYDSSLDFELQLPQVAAASESWRRALDAGSLRESLRRLFKLLRDEDARADFVAQAEDELREPVRDQVARQLRQSDALREIFDERGDLEALTLAGVAGILNRIRGWLENELNAWMVGIYPVLDETVWLGETAGAGGAIDILLLADGVGLNAYVWNLSVGDSPFKRLDIVGQAEIGMLVLTELYSQAAPAHA